MKVFGLGGALGKGHSEKCKVKWESVRMTFRSRSISMDPKMPRSVRISYRKNLEPFQGG